MKVRKAICAVVLVAVGLGAAAPSQIAIDRARKKDIAEELLYLPNEKLLNHFTGGMSSVIADLLWLRCIQYTSKHFRGDHKFTWLDHMANTITRLDPYFVDVYRYGGIFLASLKADSDASIELMKQGYRNNPKAWELPYEIAMVYLLNRRDEPDSAERAARYLGIAVATERAPESVLEILQGLQRKHNLTDLERQLWTELQRTSEDELMRDLAERKLQELALRENVGALQTIVDAFAAQMGQAPARLEDIVAAGFIDRLPEDPLGGRFFLDSEGKVKNTTLLDGLVERRLEIIRNQVESFQRQVERLPRSLDEMVDLKVVPSVPKHPYEDREWRYDPVTGEVTSGRRGW